MKTKPIISIIFLMTIAITLTTTSCQYDNETKRQLCMMDTLADTNPDTVLVMLQQMDIQSMNQSERMHAELIRGKAMNKAYVNFTTDSVMRLVADYYDRHGTLNQQMQAHYVLGCAYRDLGSAPKALEAYLDAVERADTTASDCDFRQLMLIYSQMSNVYARLYAVDADEQTLSKALSLSRRIKDSVSMNIFEDLKCEILLKEQKYSECIRLADFRRRVYLQNGKDYDADRVCVYSAEAFYELQQYDSAFAHLEKYARIFKSGSSVHQIRGGKDAYPILKGKYYLATGNPDSALSCFRKVSLPSLYLGIRAFVYRGVSDAYYMLSQKDSAYKYLVLHTQLMNQRYDSSVAEATLNAKHLYDYSVEQKIARQKETEASRVKTYLAWSLAVIVTLFAFVLYIRNRKLLAQKEAADLRLAHGHAMSALQFAEAQLQMLSSQKTEIEQRLSEETTKSVQYVDELSQISRNIQAKSDEICQLQNKIANLEQMIEPDKHTDANELLSHSEAVVALRNCLMTRGYSINSDHWKNLQQTIQHLFPNFEAVINKDGKLPKSDMQLCMLVKAKFTPSEIDYIMQMKHSYASNARKRLHKTIFGYPGSGEEFDSKIRFIK